jgi:hypothetical protein
MLTTSKLDCIPVKSLLIALLVDHILLIGLPAPLPAVLPCLLRTARFYESGAVIVVDIA